MQSGGGPAATGSCPERNPTSWVGTVACPHPKTMRGSGSRSRQFLWRESRPAASPRALHPAACTLRPRRAELPSSTPPSGSPGTTVCRPSPETPQGPPRLSPLARLRSPPRPLQGFMGSHSPRVPRSVCRTTHLEPGQDTKKWPHSATKQLWDPGQETLPPSGFLLRKCRPPHSSEARRAARARPEPWACSPSLQEPQRTEGSRLSWPSGR